MAGGRRLDYETANKRVTGPVTAAEEIFDKEAADDVAFLERLEKARRIVLDRVQRAQGAKWVQSNEQLRGVEESQNLFETTFRRIESMRQSDSHLRKFRFEFEVVESTVEVSFSELPLIFIVDIYKTGSDCLLKRRSTSGRDVLLVSCGLTALEPKNSPTIRAIIGDELSRLRKR